MLKEQKEEKLTTSFYDLLKENNEVTQDSLKEGIFGIMRIETKFASAKLNEKFHELYLNKITQINPTKDAPQYSHTPRLNANSIRLAEKSKERRIQFAKENDKKTSKPTLVDLLMMTKKAQAGFIETKRNKKTAEEAKCCTFRPATTRMTTTAGKALPPLHLQRAGRGTCKIWKAKRMHRKC